MCGALASLVLSKPVWYESARSRFSPVACYGYVLATSFIFLFANSPHKRSVLKPSNTTDLFQHIFWCKIRGNPILYRKEVNPPLGKKQKINDEQNTRKCIGSEFRVFFMNQGGIRRESQLTAVSMAACPDTARLTRAPGTISEQLSEKLDNTARKIWTRSGEVVTLPGASTCINTFVSFCSSMSGSLGRAADRRQRCRHALIPSFGLER